MQISHNRHNQNKQLRWSSCRKSSTAQQRIQGLIPIIVKLNGERRCYAQHSRKACSWGLAWVLCALACCVSSFFKCTASCYASTSTSQPIFLSMHQLGGQGTGNQHKNLSAFLPKTPKWAHGAQMISQEVWSTPCWKSLILTELCGLLTLKLTSALPLHSQLHCIFYKFSVCSSLFWSIVPVSHLASLQSSQGRKVVWKGNGGHSTY